MNDAPKPEIQPAETGRGVKPLRFDRAQVPPDFRTSGRFVNWKSETHEGRANCKIPYDPKNPQRRADSTDPATQGTLDQAIAADPEHIGLVIGPPFVAVDLDKCIAEDGTVAPWARELIASLPPTYTERSPSKRGFHLWFRGQMPKGGKKGYRASDLEVYFGDRYFTVTSDVVEGSTREITELHADQIRELLAAVEARRPSKKMESAPIAVSPHQQSAKKQLLMAGDFEAAGFADVSAAVQSLLTISAIEHLLDRDKIEADFKASGLYKDWRPHGRASNWVEKWERLRNDELDKAIAQARDTIAKKLTREKVEEIDPETWIEHLTNPSTWKIASPNEIVEGVLVEGAITVLAGLFESYKSMFALELVSAILQRRPAFDHFKVFSRHEVIYLCLDMSPAGFFRYLSFFGLHQEAGFFAIDPNSKTSLSLDDPRIQRAVKDRLLVLDTMLDYAGMKESFQSNEWIVFFQKLRRLIDQHGAVAIILIAHPTKAGARSASIDVTEYLKDSVTFGGKVDLAFAFKKEADTSKVWVQRVKQGRFYEEPIKFTITPRDENGASYLSQGRFPIVETPDQLKDEKVENRMGQLNKGGRSDDPRKGAITLLLVELRAKNPDAGRAQLAELLEKTYNEKRSGKTVERWLKEYDADQSAATAVKVMTEQIPF